MALSSCHSPRNKQIARSTLDGALFLWLSNGAATLVIKGVVEYRVVNRETEFKDPLSCFACKS